MASISFDDIPIESNDTVSINFNDIPVEEPSLLQRVKNAFGRVGEQEIKNAQVAQAMGQVANTPLINYQEPAEPPKTVSEGIIRGLKKAGAGMLTPLNIGLMPATVAAPILGPASAAVFAPEMIKSGYESLKKGKALRESGKYPEAAQAYTESVPQIAFPLMLAKEGLKGGSSAIEKGIIPESNQPKYQGAQEIGSPTEAISGNSIEQRQTGQGQEVINLPPRGGSLEGLVPLLPERAGRSMELMPSERQQGIQGERSMSNPPTKLAGGDPQLLLQKGLAPAYQIGDLSNTPTLDLIKTGFGSEVGAVGNLTPEQAAVERAARQARRELARRAKESGKDAAESLKEMGVPPAGVGQILSESQSNQEPLKAIAFRPDKINAPEDVINFITETSKKQNEFSSARQSRSNADIISESKNAPLTIEDLSSMGPDQLMNAPKAFKAREMVNGLAADVLNDLRSIDLATATPEQKAAVVSKQLKLQAAMKAMAQQRTEASHLFRSYNIKASAADMANMDALITELKKTDVAAAGDLLQYAKGSKSLLEATTGDKLWHLWYSSVLSGPSTHLKNIVGNISGLVTEATAAAIRNPRELPTAIGGLYDGLLAGAKEGQKILKEGQPSKFEERGLKPIVFTGKASFLNAADYVGRALGAADAFFKGGLTNMELKGLAREQALKEGLKGEARASRTEEIYKNPSPELAAQADEFGLRGTYNQQPQGVIGSIANGIATVTRDHPGAKLIVPFTRVVANVINNAIDLTPQGFTRAISGKMKGALTERQYHQQLARATLGTIGMSFFAALAAENKLTGDGPRDYQKKEQLLASGWRPNSIKIGDTYYPFTQLGPMALPAAIVGNYVDSVKYGNLDQKDALERTTAAVLGTVNTIQSMSFLSGLSSLVTAINESQTRGGSYAKNFIAQQATTVVPSAVKQVARYFDPTVYDAQSIWEKVQSSLRITKGLRPKIDVLGDVVLGDPLTQLTPSKETKDPVKKFLFDNQLFISVPPKNTELFDVKQGKKRPMTHDEYYDYIKTSGVKIKEILGRMLPTLENIQNNEMRQKVVDEVASQVRAMARGEIIGEQNAQQELENEQ